MYGIYLEKILRKKKLIIVLSLLISISILLYYDIEYSPGEIPFNKINQKNGNFSFQRVAEDLLIQQYVKGEGVYASRGYDIYFLKENGTIFNRIGRIPIPLGISYLGNSKTARYYLNQNELLELIKLRSGAILVFGGGFIFRADKTNEYNLDFKLTGKINHFGLSKGRGIMPQGYAETSSGVIYWGEYWSNPNKEAVKIWKSEDDGYSWNVAYEFKPGKIRHIHAVQFDSHSKKIWVLTGDNDHECYIGYLDNNDTFIPIGNGSQKWRAVSLIFTNDYVYWGTDGTSEKFPNNQIWSWNRETKETILLTDIDSNAYYSAFSNDIKIITTGGGGEGATFWVSTVDNNWFEGASFKKNREGHHGTIKIKAGSRNSFYASMNNLLEYNNDLLQFIIN